MGKTLHQWSSILVLEGMFLCFDTYVINSFTWKQLKHAGLWPWRARIKDHFTTEVWDALTALSPWLSLPPCGQFMVQHFYFLFFLTHWPQQAYLGDTSDCIALTLFFLITEGQRWESLFLLYVCLLKKISHEPVDRWSFQKATIRCISTTSGVKPNRPQPGDLQNKRKCLSFNQFCRYWPKNCCVYVAKKIILLLD